MTTDLPGAIRRVRAFTKACPASVDAIVTLRPLEPAGDPISLHLADVLALLDAAEPRDKRRMILTDKGADAVNAYRAHRTPQNPELRAGKTGGPT